MPIPCPGSETYSHIFGVGRRGNTPFAAFLRAFLVLLLEIAGSASLRRFLAKTCRAPCVKSISGPTFSNFTVRIVPQGAGWHCVMGGTLEARIDCDKVEAVAFDASDQQLLAGLLKHLGKAERERG